MKKIFLTILILMTITLNPFPLSSTLQSWYVSVASYFQYTTPSCQKPDEQLSLFQQLFRESITYTHHKTNIFINALYELQQDASANLISFEKIGDTFITKLQAQKRLFITTAFEQILDVDLNMITPLIQEIYRSLEAITASINALEKTTLKHQSTHLAQLLTTLQSDIKYCQGKPIATLIAIASLPSSTGKEKNIKGALKRIHNIYPEIISSINNLELEVMGNTLQTITNTISVLLEKLVLLHRASGALGKILIEPELVTPIDILKNNIRKIGNTIEFTMATKPLIVIAPPSTHEAVVEIIKTFVLHDGIDIYATITKEITMINTQISSIMTMKKPLTSQMISLKKESLNMPETIQTSFIQTIIANPTYAIPRAPQVLLELLEQRIEQIKKNIQATIINSIDCIERISVILFVSSSLCDYTGRLMGATPDKPFFNPQIVKGLGYLAEDILDMNATINLTNTAITNYHFRVIDEDEE